MRPLVLAVLHSLYDLAQELREQSGPRRRGRLDTVRDPVQLGRVVHDSAVAPAGLVSVLLRLQFPERFGEFPREKDFPQRHGFCFGLDLGFRVSISFVKGRVLLWRQEGCGGREVDDEYREIKK